MLAGTEAGDGTEPKTEASGAGDGDGPERKPGANGAGETDPPRAGRMGTPPPEARPARAGDGTAGAVGAGEEGAAVLSVSFCDRTS